MIDYHLHTTHSGDAELTIAEVCAGMIERGFKEICFTEHVDFEPTDLSYNTYKYDEYALELNAAREEFGDKIEIRSGIEVDYRLNFAHTIEEYLKNLKFDYVLGAAHYVDGIILIDRERMFNGRSADDVYIQHFQTTLEAVKTGWFDSFAHLDYGKRYGVEYFGAFDWTQYREYIEPILSAIIDQDMSLEINTAGLRHPAGEQYPSMGILKRYRELGGENITVGSDSHRIDHLGANIECALDIARKAGFEYVDSFRNRTRTKIRL